MKNLTRHALGFGWSMMLASSVWAGEAETWASANNGALGSGSAAAGASYQGDGGQGFARTRTFSGDVARSRAVAVGFDRDGLEISVSHALAGRFGLLPAYAGTFNLSIGLDGSVSRSYGGSVVQGGLVRSAEAGGSAASGWNGARSSATASGTALPDGVVTVQTHSHSQPPVVRYLAARPVMIVRR